MTAEVDQLFQTVRGYCLAQPNALEKPSHGAPAFFIEKGGQFACLYDNHHNDGKIGVLLAMPPGMQEALIQSDPEVFYRPPYVGPYGWVGVCLDKGLAWTEVEDLVNEAYAFIAAKRKGGRQDSPTRKR